MLGLLEPGIPEAMMFAWQGVVDILAGVVCVPSALVMRVVGSEIEVLVASASEGNPYHAGDRETLAGSGLYCETVIKSKYPLLVSDAREDPEWSDNPDMALHMYSYLGYPLLLPDGSAFGTICVLDDKSNSYSELYNRFLQHFKALIESDLAILVKNRELEEENRSLRNTLGQLQASGNTG